MDLKLSQEELPKILKVGPSTISYWENRGRKLLPRTMKKVIAFLGYIPPLGVNEHTLGGQLYIFRMKKGLTSEKVARILKVDKWAITKIESGREVKLKYKHKVLEYISVG